MTDDLFELLERTFRSEGPRAGFDVLIRRLQEEKSYSQVFAARLMQKRHALGLPLVLTGTFVDRPSERRSAYEATQAEAAREAGNAYLADGNIARAWPYFRAIGDVAPVAAAIEDVHSSEGLDSVLAIALYEGVNPRKGFELLLKYRGICEGVGVATQCPDRDTRLMFLQLLISAFYNELTAHLKEAIASAEGRTSEANRVAELISGRDWLFDNGHFYIENSHLASIVQASPELEDPECVRLVLELTDYGRHLAPMHHFPSKPPFEDTYVDHAVYLRALLGENVDDAVAHFYQKMDGSVRSAAEVLVGLLVRLGRYQEAIHVSLEHLSGEASGGCPSAMQLCQMAGDFQRLRDVARKEGDVLGFTAGIIQS